MSSAAIRLYDLLCR